MPRARGAVLKPTSEASARKRRERIEVRLSIAVTVTTIFVLGPLLFLDDEFVRGTRSYRAYSLGHVATRDAVWFVALAASVLAPVCWWTWRRTGFPILRAAGLVLAGSAAAAVVVAVSQDRIPAANDI